ncbi:hypothetical protein D9615_003725 [Tricholomella constricta]|uniref:CCZ1/INTU/HSP4 first Longin domain-containing protein n=1 Tax=Tricholomella constricta TaxID=117010 RepID=A0A8H5HI21_9AGAR|nr:hypothetical protein D9615_003725 [Tricholomella constricta]
MSRIPPNLLYLTIYNPTLHPAGLVQDDDEDAEEQAHILFYTSRERAVSRDRMLRQVGLAKALVNFSDLFNGTDSCDNVHSQSKRLVMVSPEPEFWIHAGVEVAKVPRAPLDTDKGKGRSKSNGKGKEKEKESEAATLFDYQEGSVHDLALRADILRAYEQFKLLHGSFTSVLSTIGQEGLELQLERFFTVWAWSWNLEDGREFGDHLGVSLHPSMRSIGPLLDSYTTQLPNRASSIFIQPPYVVPSSQYSAANSKHSTSLPRYLLSLIPPTPPTSQDHSHDGSVKGRRPSTSDPPNGKDPPSGVQRQSGSTFLGMPAMNMNVNVDVKKWGWPGYLTFGKGAGKRPGLEEDIKKVAIAARVDDAQVTVTRPAEAIGLDKSALEDAFSDNASISASTTSTDDREGANPALSSNDEDIAFSTPTQPNDATKEPEGSLDIVEPQVFHSRDPADADSSSLASSSSTVPAVEPPVSPSKTPPPPEFSSVKVYLADPANPLLTIHQKVYYILSDRSMVALVGLDQDQDPSLELAQSTVALLDEIETELTADLSQTFVSKKPLDTPPFLLTSNIRITPDQIPTLSKILQPTDTHIISTGHFTVSSPNFSSKSGYLYDAQELQTMDPDISEVFSRGQNPQHWHIARQGLGASAYGQRAADEGEVYMQIFRKEASLSDVDNVLAGVVRRSGLVDGTV